MPVPQAADTVAAQAADTAAARAADTAAAHLQGYPDGGRGVSSHRSVHLRVKCHGIFFCAVIIHGKNSRIVVLYGFPQCLFAFLDTLISVPPYVVMTRHIVINSSVRTPSGSRIR